MCVLILCTTLFWNIAHSKKNLAKCDHNRTIVFMCSARYSDSYINESWIFSTDFWKILKLAWFSSAFSRKRISSFRLDHYLSHKFHNP
jgi:hypothetical protein